MFGHQKNQNRCSILNEVFMKCVVKLLYALHMDFHKYEENIQTFIKFSWWLEELPDRFTTATHKCVSLFWRMFFGTFLDKVQKGHHA